MLQIVKPVGLIIGIVVVCLGPAAACTAGDRWRRAECVPAAAVLHCAARQHSVPGQSGAAAAAGGVAAAVSQGRHAAALHHDRHALPHGAGGLPYLSAQVGCLTSRYRWVTLPHGADGLPYLAVQVGYPTSRDRWVTLPHVARYIGFS